MRTEWLHGRSGITVSKIDLNTPQFDWARAHIALQPRPMGQPVEPEVIAEVVFRAAGGSSREYWLGRQTLPTILGNAIAPSWLDRYLARKAVAGEQIAVSLVPGREDNLDHPVTVSSCSARCCSSRWAPRQGRASRAGGAEASSRCARRG